MSVNFYGVLLCGNFSSGIVLTEMTTFPVTVFSLSFATFDENACKYCIYNSYLSFTCMSDYVFTDRVYGSVQYLVCLFVGYESLQAY